MKTPDYTAARVLYALVSVHTEELSLKQGKKLTVDPFDKVSLTTKEHYRFGAWALEQTIRPTVCLDCRQGKHYLCKCECLCVTEKEQTQ